MSAAICCYLLPNMSPRWSKKPAKPPGMVPEGPQGVPRCPPGVSKRPPGRLPRHHLRAPGKPKIVPRCLPGPLRTTSHEFEPELIDFGCQNRSKKQRKNVKKLIAFPDAVWNRLLYFLCLKIHKKTPKKIDAKWGQKTTQKKNNDFLKIVVLPR